MLLLSTALEIGITFICRGRPRDCVRLTLESFSIYRFLEPLTLEEELGGVSVRFTLISSLIRILMPFVSFEVFYHAGK